MIAVAAGKIHPPSSKMESSVPSSNGVATDAPSSAVASTNERTNGDGADAKQHPETTSDQWELDGRSDGWTATKKMPPTNLGKGGLPPNRTMPSFCLHPGTGSGGTSPNHGGGGMMSTPTPPAGQHVVHLHVNPGEAISLQMGDHLQVIQGPATVRMVSNSTSPPIPVPVQVPPGHMVQQIVDENGTLRHVIFSPQPPPMAVPMAPNYGAGPAPATAAATTPFYTFPHPAFPPPPTLHPHPSHFHPHHPPPHLQAATMSHQMHQHPHQGPSPPLLHALHKDDRTNKQFLKLRRKLDARQRASSHANNSTTSTHTCPPVSPKKVDNVSRKSRDRKLCTPSSDDTDENHNQEDEEASRILSELLSKLTVPHVSEVSPRSACLRWNPPEMHSENGSNKFGGLDIQESEFVYDLMLLSDRSGEGKCQVIYSGGDMEYTITNLKPAKEYHVCLQVSLDDLRGNPTEVFTFKTQPCKPDTPSPPKLLNRSKSSLTLRWNPVTENGARLSAYVLEWDEGIGGAKFVEVYGGLQKQYRINKLATATVYRFRLFVKSDKGPSDYSEVVGFATSGTIPTQPQPPILKEATVTKLHFTWELRPHDDNYILQMDDDATPYGFLPVYNGPEGECTCSELRRNAEYKFRLAASNEEGTGRWSDIVVARTLPDRPLPPGRPNLKGKNQSTWCKVAWEPPKDDGGAAVIRYRLEMAAEGGEFRVVYEGTDNECRSDNLQPGSTYLYKAAAVGPGGWSEYSEVGSISTLPVVPGQCSPPMLDGKAKAISLQLRWTRPDYNGGAAITDFEVELTNPDQSARIAYRGHDTECVVAGLLPGRPYQFRVRSINKAGAGPWSDNLELLSGAGPPERPLAPVVTCKSPHSAQITWQEPLANGAVIAEYRLEYSQAEGAFSQIFAGQTLGFEIRTLAPARRYDFRVQAVNSEGGSEFSEAASCVTPPSLPGAVSSTTIHTSVTPTSIHLSWQEPANHGSEIVAYNLDFNEKLPSTTVHGCSSHTMQGLTPETVYRIKVQAVNGIGCGPFSAVVKTSTKALPPPPPRLECMFASYNCIKLKWGDSKSIDFNTYRLEIETRHGSYTTVYQGLLHNHKVVKLAETTSYRFRILASNEAGDGPPSEVYVFATTKAPPPAIKAPKVLSVTETSCTVEWHSVKPMGDDLILYQLQLLNGRQQEGRLVYKGADTRHCVQNLEPRTEYQVRVGAIRQHRDTLAPLAGPFSPCAHLTTQCNEPVSLSDKSSAVQEAILANTTKSTEPSVGAETEPMDSDKKWAIAILFGFVFIAVLIAVLIQQLRT